MLSGRFPGHGLLQEAVRQVFRADEVRCVVWRAVRHVETANIPAGPQTPDPADHVPFAPSWHVLEAVLEVELSILIVQLGHTREEDPTILLLSVYTHPECQKAQQFFSCFTGR